jgi:hypothetical protein
MADHRPGSSSDRKSAPRFESRFAFRGGIGGEAGPTPERRSAAGLGSDQVTPSRPGTSAERKIARMNIHRLAESLRDYAGFRPGVVVSPLVVGLVACGYASRALRISRVHGWALLMSLGVILSATITPSREALLFGQLRGSISGDPWQGRRKE